VSPEATISGTSRFGGARPPVCEGYTPTAFYPPIDDEGCGTNNVLSDAGGHVFYAVYGSVFPVVATPFHCGTLRFHRGNYHTAIGGMPLGWGSECEAWTDSYVGTWIARASPT
jgi:hypothetical protein